MITSLAHAVDRTIATFDQLGAMWGPAAHVNLTIHGLTHTQVHEIGASGGVEHGPSADYAEHPYVCATVRTRLGWSVGFFAVADLACDRCRELGGLPSEATEAAQVAGIFDRMDGSGL